MFRSLNELEAAAKIAILSTPASRAAVIPVSLGTSAEYTTPSRRSMDSNTAAASASCGTHCGLTKLLTSISANPLIDSALMNATFCWTGIMTASF